MQTERPVACSIEATKFHSRGPKAVVRQWGWSVAIGGDACARGQSLLRYTIQTAKRAIDKLVKQDGARTSDQNPGSGNAGHAPDGTCLAMP